MQGLTLKRHVASWLTMLRIGPAARGILPFLLGTVIAWSQGYLINWMVVALSSAAVLGIMLMTFLINDYYDYEADLLNKDFHRLSGGSRILTLGLVPRHRALGSARVLLSLSACVGLVLYFGYNTGPYTIPMGTLAILIGYFYTAKPLQLCYRGLGEVAIWFSCGWLATIAGYYLQTGHFDTVATLASLPGATSVFLLILINEVPDIASDSASGKRNLAVRLGKEKTAALYIALLIACYANIVAIIFFGVPRVSALLSLILLPLMGWNILTLRKKGSLEEGKTLEGLSIRTMMIDHLITIIYTVAFILAGLSLVVVKLEQVVMIAIAYAVVFVLEGLSLFCSKMATEQ